MKTKQAYARFESAGENITAAKQTYRAQLAALQANHDYSEEYRTKRAAELKAAHLAELRALVARRVQTFGDYEAAVRQERRDAEQAHEQQFDHSRMSWYAREFAARLATASTPEQFEALKGEVDASGDPNQRRAFRTVAIERAATLQDRHVKMWANRFINLLTDENARDISPELAELRNTENALPELNAAYREAIRQMGNEIKRPGMWQGNFFAVELGESTNAGEVVLSNA